MKLERREAKKHKGLVDHLSQFDDFEAKLDEAMTHPDFVLVSEETKVEYRAILVREVLLKRGQ